LISNKTNNIIATMNNSNLDSDYLRKKRTKVLISELNQDFGKYKCFESHFKIKNEISISFKPIEKKPSPTCIICKQIAVKHYPDDNDENEMYFLICGHTLHIDCVIPDIIKDYELSEFYPCDLCKTKDPNIIIYVKGNTATSILQEVHEYEISKEFNRDCYFILEALILIWFYYANYLLVTKIVLPEAHKQVLFIINLIIDSL
jgi:hypothetical protein